MPMPPELKNTTEELILCSSADIAIGEYYQKRSIAPTSKYTENQIIQTINLDASEIQTNETKNIREYIKETLKFFRIKNREHATNTEILHLYIKHRYEMYHEIWKYAINIFKTGYKLQKKIGYFSQSYWIKQNYGINPKLILAYDPINTLEKQLQYIQKTGTIYYMMTTAMFIPDKIPYLLNKKFPNIEITLKCRDDIYPKRTTTIIAKKENRL